MIKIFGKVPYDDPTNGAVFELQECIDECFAIPGCILSYMDSKNNCLMYDYSTILILNVTETTRADGYYVAFKVDLKPDTCPADYRAIEYCGLIGSFKFCWDMTSTDWVITNLCPEPWKKFVRDNGVTVCLQGFKGSSVTKSTAVAQCESKGYKLTGVASVEESLWMQEQMVALQQVRGFWVDGERTAECVTGGCNVFQWTDGYTVGSVATNSSLGSFSFVNGGYKENCLTILPGNFTMNDVSCDSYKATGYFCGFQMINP